MCVLLLFKSQNRPVSEKEVTFYFSTITLFDISLFTDTIACVKIPKNLQRAPELISEFSKVPGYKSNSK